MKLESTLASWMSDVLHGLRLGLRRPFFSLAVVALLALGIGATTTIFSFVDGVLLSDLPYPEPERLIVTVAACDDASVNVENGSVASLKSASKTSVPPIPS